MPSLVELLENALSASSEELERICISYKVSDESVSVGLYSSSDLPKDTFTQLFDLTKRNMSQMYERCRGWGWNSKQKKKEFKHKDSRFVVIQKQSSQEKEGKRKLSGDVAGFVHFRFEIDEDEPDVLQLYIWEIQLDASVHRNGFGRMLMKKMDELAKHYNIPLVKLTVFKGKIAKL
jgi:hypothetical protein